MKLKMLQKYIDLRNKVLSQKQILEKSILDGRNELEKLHESISECQKSLVKGNGFSQLMSSQYRDMLEKAKPRILLDITSKKSSLEKDRKELKDLIKSNPFLEVLENYEKVVPSEEFKKSLVDLVEASKAGKVPFEVLEKAKINSLKFKELSFGDKKYMVKDNRKNYSDMIIFNPENKILFCKRNKEDEFQPNKYALPGGHVEPAEDPLLAAIREVEEEVGITLDSQRVSPVGIYEDSGVVINYFCTKIDDTFINLVLEERELQQYEWVSLDNISELDLILNLKNNFETVIEIPTTILNNGVNSKEIEVFYGLGIESVVSTGYPN